MTATPSVYSITYGATTVPGTVGSSRVELRRVYEVDKGYRAFRVAFSLILVSSSEANFKADADTLEALFRTPRNDLVVKVNTTEILDLRHSSNAALNVESAISQPGSPVDTERSRLYEVEITGGLPADLSGQSGLDGFRYRLQDTKSEQVLTARGRYTPTGSATQSRAQYLANVQTRVDTITTALGGTWELASDDHETDDTDQITTFTRVYRRLVYNQSSGTLDHAKLRNQRLAVDRGRRSLSGDPNDNPLQELALVYRADIDREDVDDGSGVVEFSQVLSLWEDVVRPWLVENLENAVDNTVAITFERPRLTFDPPGIQAQMQAIAMGPGGNVVSTSVRTIDRTAGGHTIGRTWPTGDVDADSAAPTPAYVNTAPKRVTRTVQIVTTTLGTCDIAPVGEGANAVPKPTFVGGTGYTIHWQTEFADRTEGRPDGNTLDFCDRIDEAVFGLVADPEGGGE